MLIDGLNSIRQRGSQVLRDAIIGDEELAPHEVASADDHGLFGPDSVAWKVHGDSSMLIGGIRSLLVQTLHPLAMAGVSDHSDYRHDPWGRLNRTGRFVGATTFGSTESAEAAIEIVKRVHTRVIGTAPDGRHYEANDPHLLLWVHIAEVSSFLAAYDRYGAEKLTDVERDRYVAEMAEVARRLGSETPPTSMAELKASLRAFRPEMQVGAQAREAVRFLVFPPMSPLMRGSYAILLAAAVTSLPRWVRWELRLPVLPLSDKLAVRPAATVATKAIGWLMSARESPTNDMLASS